MSPAGYLKRALALVLASSLLATACSWETQNLVPPVPETSQTSSILSRDATLITEPPSDENRTIVSIDEIPQVMIDAVVAIEDERFFEHDGVDVTGLLRSASRGVSEGEISGGGSTITMQYVGNVFLDRSQQTASRKLDEIVLARQFEQQWTKEFILQEYLNWIFFGARSYGVEAAAQQYFDTSVSNLTLAQAALLAGLIQAPSRLNPYENPEDAINRREDVLDAMLRNDFITQDEYLEARDDPMNLAPEFDEVESQYPAGHFIEEVKAWILDGKFMTDDWIAENPAKADELATYQSREDLLFRGGIRVRTTIDLQLQRMAEAAVEAIIPDGTGVPDASVVILDPSNGEVLAMVGGRDFFGDSDFSNVNLAMGEGRQAGSSMKPLALAAAIERGIPVTKTYEAPPRIELQPPDLIEPWKVRGGSRTGRSDLIDATIWSRNTVYAQLSVELGADTIPEMASRLGMQSEIAPVYASVLGTENVTTLDLAAAYSTFANRGVQHDPVFVTEILNPDGTSLWRHEPAGERVLETDDVDQLTWILSRVIESGTGRDADFGRPAAGKTGTAQNYADATFAGYTPDLAVAVWVGFPQGQISMVPCSRKACTEEDPGTPIQVAGGTYPARIWREVMTGAHAGVPATEFADPPASAPPTTFLNLPDSVETPDLFGQTAEEATVTLDGSSLQLSVVEVVNLNFPTGTVFNQAPPAGSSVPGGGTVTVEVARGPFLETVPNVVGLAANPGRRAITREGFIVEQRFVTVDGAPINPQSESGTIIEQVPFAGTQAEVGSTISIKIQKQ